MKKILAIALVFALLTSFVAAIAVDWDKSSLSFTTTDLGCNMVKATVCNTGSDMLGSVNYAVYYSEDGNPKTGSILDTGTLGPLLAEECTDLVFDGNLADGNYMFWAAQRPGHPGQGQLWSDAIEYSKDMCNEVPEFGVVAASIALIGAIGIFIYKRNN